MTDVTTKTKIAVIVDDERFEFDMPAEAENILEAALDKGIDLPSSCRAGICASCRAKVLEGEVSLASDIALDEDEIAEGYALACQAKPLTSNVTLDFDID